MVLPPPAQQHRKPTQTQQGEARGFGGERLGRCFQHSIFAGGTPRTEWNEMDRIRLPAGVEVEVNRQPRHVRVSEAQREH